MNIRPIFFAALIAACILPLSTAFAQPPPAPAAPVFSPLFNDSERAAAVTYWNAPNRYRITAPTEAATQGAWVVRLTPEGSVWLLAYQRAVAGSSKLPPTVDIVAGNKTWEKWVTARVAYDRYIAAQAANAANSLIVLSPPGPISSPPAVPDPIPATLLAAVGNPPPFARAVAPLRYIVTFDSGDTYEYPDNVKMRERYGYYRFSNGTVAYGPELKAMPDSELAPLFAAAGFNPSEQRIARAVSVLEGGFETVNTYDTGYVSIGFIQFVTLDTGRESLSEVLLREKQDHPRDFQDNFRRFGIDIRKEDLSIAVVDPATGVELVGTPAVLKIIDDKRLTAVFQRAGHSSKSFRVAQIQVAKSRYWPANDPVRVTLADGSTVSGAVSDVVKSEAGMATLFDRKVNRGNITPFADVLQNVMRKYKLTRLRDATRYEREIVQPLKYRADFLADKTLSQPK